MKTTDYIFCRDCNMFIDLWKYDHDIQAAGHENCQWRHVLPEELGECLDDCEIEGCFAKVR